jgi:hypothetical protein
MGSLISCSDYSSFSADLCLVASPDGNRQLWESSCSGSRLSESRGESSDAPGDTAPGCSMYYEGPLKGLMLETIGNEINS